MKNTILTTLSALLIFIVGCKQEKKETQEEQVSVETAETKELDAIFPKGEKGPDKYFTGNAYNIGLVPPDSTYTTVVGNVYFEPGARSNWHTHPGGQILIITDGKGYHQIDGQSKEIMEKGDVIQCPPNTRHWHGASEDTGLQQMYIVPNTEKGIVDWMEAVTDNQYQAN